ncbi:MAG TPA: 50S ribosomal protein L21, partial [Actinomycetota bacterium]|nr:50S ribosomal protein L21 [Actinomycetota bacterium]
MTEGLMYAVIRAGGKQHKVKPGDVIEVEHLPAVGERVEFTPILVVDDEGRAHVGKEAAAGVVTARPVGERKGEKVKVFRYRPKTGYARRGGHRQLYTLIEIEDVRLGARGRRTAKGTRKEPAAGSEAHP